MMVGLHTWVADVWVGVGLLLAGVFLVPVLVVLASVFDPQPEVWHHLLSTIIPMKVFVK